MKKSLLITAWLGAFVCAVTLFCACGAKEERAAPEAVPAAVEIAPEELETQTHDTKYKNGIFTAGRKGYGSDVLVTATIANDEIIELEIEGAEETKGVGRVSIERMRTRILEAQFGEVDGVSGATETSEAIKGALEDILRKAEY